MSAVRPLDTRPERVVRRILTGLGYRYRLHRYDLPGRPDIVFPGRRKLILVHGCFWHRHTGCPRTTTPAKNVALWEEKFRRTLCRDREHLDALQGAGWQVLVLWECEIGGVAGLKSRLVEFLDAD